MHGPSLSAILVSVTLGFLSATTTAGTPDLIAEARRKLAANDGVGAVTILEAALPDAGPSKDAVIGLLDRAYQMAADQAQKSMRTRDAETYLENRKILGRKPKSARTDASLTQQPPAAPVQEAPRATRPGSDAPTNDPPAEPLPLPEGPPSTETDRPEPSPTKVVDDPLSGPEARPIGDQKSKRVAEESPLLAIPAAEPASDLEVADAAFDGKDYREAGRIYDLMARDRRLPPDRRDQWLYCRLCEVAARINAQPKTKLEWAGINEEIGKIQALNPQFWPSEYLRRVAAAHQATQKKAKASNTMIVRGSAPEEPPPTDPPVRPASNASPAEPARPSPALTSNNAAASRIGTNVGRWQIHDSANFRIYHADPTLAAKVAKAAEAARVDQTKRWANNPPKGTWSPQCEIYLYPTARQYSQMTGQPEDSPGFSTMGMNNGKITSRRINLRADHPTLVVAVLPHEITHVILADFFTEQQIPRWADEGLAVLSEPADEQQRRAADLITPLSQNRLFAVDALMQMDYPDNRYWALYYAESVSLTRFLVEQGTPAQMIQFLQWTQREGYEAALRRIYQIDGFPDLQRRWLAYARSKTGPQTTAAAPANGPDLKVR